MPPEVATVHLVADITHEGYMYDEEARGPFWE